VNSPARQQPARKDSRDVPQWMSACLAGAILAVYALLPTKNYYWDGVSFAQNIEQAGGLKSPLFWTSLIHPNHLVYNGIGYLVWIALHSLGFQIRALPILQAMNMAAAAACCWLMQRLLLRTTRSAYLSTTLTLLLAFSAVFWKYATDSDAYILSALFLLATFSVLTSTSEARPLPAGLLHAAAMLVHQLAFLFFPAAALGIFLKGGWKALWRYCLLAGGITLPAYYAGFWLQQRDTNPAAFVRWLTSHSPDAIFRFNVPRNLAITVSSYSRLFFGGTGHALQFFGPFMLATFILLVLALAALTVAVVRYWDDFRLLNRPGWAGDSLLLAVVWLAAYVVFLFFWLPQNTFYKLFCLPAIVFIAGQWLAQYRGPRRHRLALFVVTMALANLALYIFPYSRPEYNQALRFAARMRPLWSDRTVVYYNNFIVDDWFIRYFNPQTTWKPMDAATFVERAGRDRQSGEEVWVDPTAAEVLGASGSAAFDATQQDNYPVHPIRFYRWNPH
jgi:hypothetical protein